METFKFNIYFNTIQDNLNQIADINKIWLYKYHNDIFNTIDFDNDLAFLEPELFYHTYRQTQDKNIIKQVLFDYINQEKSSFLITADSEGLVNLRNSGYVRLLPNEKISYNYIQDLEKIKPIFLVNTNIKILQHTPINFITEKINLDINFETNLITINQALTFFSSETKSLFELFKLILKEVFIFNSAEENSMASRAFFGTIFLNTMHKNNDILFFIDEIAHQGGHNLFYLLIFNEHLFFTYSPDTKICELNNDYYDKRSIEIVFHSLFTLFMITFSLDSYIKSNNQKYDLKKEALFRLGFYYLKLEKDIMRLDEKNNILSEMGINYYNLIIEHFTTLQNQ